MPRKRHTQEQIIGKLREADVGLGFGANVSTARIKAEIAMVGRLVYHHDRKRRSFGECWMTNGSSSLCPRGRLKEQ